MSLSSHRVIYPGSFDPVTFGHLDIISRSSRIFDQIIIAVAENSDKQSLFTISERVNLIQSILPHSSHVKVETFSGLIVDFCRQKDIFTIIRGMRLMSDFELESQFAFMNHRLDKRIETIFFTSSENSTFVSSRLVKEIARFGGETSSFVPLLVEKALKKKFLNS